MPSLFYSSCLFKANITSPISQTKKLRQGTVKWFVLKLILSCMILLDLCCPGLCMKVVRGQKEKCFQIFTEASEQWTCKRAIMGTTVCEGSTPLGMRKVGGAGDLGSGINLHLCYTYTCALSIAHLPPVQQTCSVPSSLSLSSNLSGLPFSLFLTCGVKEILSSLINKNYACNPVLLGPSESWLSCYQVLVAVE